MKHAIRANVAAAFIAIGFVIGILGGAMSASGWRGSRWECFWPVYLAYILAAGGLGLASPSCGWLAGAMMMLAHWCFLLVVGGVSHTSTIGAGHLIALLASIPPTLAAYVLGKFARFRDRQVDRPIDPPST